jgi:hypothetical protein
VVLHGLVYVEVGARRRVEAGDVSRRSCEDHSHMGRQTWRAPVRPPGATTIVDWRALPGQALVCIMSI